MTEESRVSRTPRTWPPGSSEPMDVAAVRSEQNGVVFKARDSKTWGRDWLATRESEGDGQYYRWFQMNSDSASEGAMTLVEVLPDAPEPQPLLDWIIPDHVEIGAFGENEVQLRCKASHEAHERVVLKTFETDNRIADFLKHHAHGETVERRPGSSTGGSSVSSLSNDTTRPDKPATEALSGEPRIWLAGFLYGFCPGTSEADAAVAAEEIIEEFLSVGWRPPSAPLSGVELRDAEERDDAAGDLP